MIYFYLSCDSVGGALLYYSQEQADDSGKSREELIKELKELRYRMTATKQELDADAHDRKGTELEAGDSTLQMIAGNINEVIFMFTPDWREAIYVSPAYEKIWGRPADEVYRDARSWLDAIVPGDRGLVETFIEGQSRGEVSFENSIEYRISTPGGDVRWINGRTYPVRDGSGNIARVAGIAEDITVRRKAEDQLLESEKFLNNIFDCFQDGISILDKDLNIVRVNHVMEKWHPYMMPLCGKKCYHAYHERSEPCEQCPSIRAIRTGMAQSEVVPLHGEHNVLRGWLELFAYPLTDDDGNVIGVIEHVRDITGRKRTENALRESEEKYRSLVENINDMVWEMDKDFRVTYASPRIRDIMGYDAEEVIGKQPFDFIVPADLDKFGSLMDEAVRARAPLELVGYRVRRKDGRVVYFETNGMPIFNRDGSFRGYRGINRDITERKQAEESLELMQHMIDQAEDEASLARPDGRFIYVNDAKCRSLGYTKEELLSMNVWDVDPDMTPEMWHGAWQGLKEKSHIKQESRHRLKDGRTIPTEIWATYLNFHGGEYVCAFVRDITDRKRAEKSLKLTQFTMDRAADMILWVAPDSRFIYINEAACRAFGYTREEMIAMSAFDTRPAWTEETWAAHWREVKERGSFTFEASLRKKDGSFFPGEISVNYLVYDGKEYNCSFIRDITERKKAEDAFRVASAYNRSLIEASRDPLVTIAPDGRITDVNAATEAVTGLPRKALVGTDFSDYFTEPAKAREGYMTVFREGSVTDYPLEIRHRTGSVTPVIYNASVYRDEAGKVIGVFAAARDITERKRVEEALKESEEKFRVLAETTRAGIMLFRGTNVVYVNPALEHISGYDRDELLQMKYLGTGGPRAAGNGPEPRAVAPARPPVGAGDLRTQDPVEIRGDKVGRALSGPH